MNTTPNLDDTAPTPDPTRVSVGDVEVDSELLTGPGALLWWLVQQLTGTTRSWQVPTEAEGTFPRAGWRLLHPALPCTPADPHQPVTYVVAAPATHLVSDQDGDDLWVQVQLTGCPGEPDSRWHATRIGTHHRVRPTRQDRARGLELRWVTPTTTTTGTVTGSGATLVVELVNVGTTPWSGDPDDCLAVTTWVDTTPTSPASSTARLTRDPAPAGADLDLGAARQDLVAAGESTVPATSTAPDSPRTVHAGTDEVFAEVTSLGLRTPTRTRGAER